MNYKSNIDSVVTEKRFSISKCINFKELLDEESMEEYRAIERKLTKKEFKLLRCGLVRSSFLIQLVKGDVSSTKVVTRWSDKLKNDVRYASFDECVKILNKLLNKIANLTEADLEILKELLNNQVLPYEISVDYIDRFAEPIHTVNNIDLYINDDVKNCVNVRSFIHNDQKNPESKVFKEILTKKIKVKTYRTDRALTGDYKSNRENRWEADPGSVQFALRRDCMKIETKLLLQIATFEGCDPGLVENLQNDGLLSTSYEYCKCPITGDNIQYSEFATKVLHPTHGKSEFQVGHLNPLKAMDKDGKNGHTADNISWMSEDGNRIQGSLSLAETDELLKRIYKNRPELMN